jgi:ketol-acid reductoisomerase
MSGRRRDRKNETASTRRTVAIIGCGAAGEAHALNLRESGTTKVVGLNKGGRPWEKTAAEGFAVYPLDEVSWGGRVLENTLEKPGKRPVEKDGVS